MPPSDPLYASQWHFPLIGDVESIWAEYTGNGVSVGVYDDGISYEHADLNGNYDNTRHVLDGSNSPVDPYPVNYTSGGDGHGTAVAGLVAAEEGNGLGGVGVAWDAGITGVNIFDSGTYGYKDGPLANFLAVVQQAGAFDISVNSWGAFPFGQSSQNLGTPGSFAAQLHSSYEALTSTGRGGLGTLILQQAGDFNNDANLDGVNASRFTATVAGTTDAGFATTGTNFGTSILVAAPAAAVTTDLLGSAGYDPTDYAGTFGGTSGANAVASGVVALMLEANPALGWRDIHNILAASATLTGSALGAPPATNEDGAWQTNAADNWNNGGYHLHSNYGYGMIDAFKAVRMAEAWSLFHPVARKSSNESMVTGSNNFADTVLPDSSPTGYQFTINIADWIEIEHVALKLTFTTSFIGDLRIVLTSPEGTELVVQRQDGGVGTNFDGTWIYGIDSLRGELSSGTWTVHVSDNFGGDLTTLRAGALDIYGAASLIHDVHHLTNEYLTMESAEAARATAIDDIDGGLDWLNLAAVTGNVALTLGGGLSVAGVAWNTVTAAIENAVLGDGNDNVTGSAVANTLYGMRGIDILTGLDGNDRLYGGASSDRLIGGNGHDILDGGTGFDTLEGGTGNDRYVVNGTGDVIQGEVGFASGGGIDTVTSSANTWTLGANLEVLRLLGTANIDGFGNAAPESLVGNPGQNMLGGGGGNDLINAKAGNDTLDGGTGLDSLVGDTGADTFVYDAIADSYAGSSTRDFINGFTHGADRIDLSAIDANPYRSGDQAFEFLGNAPFDGAGATSAGQLRYFTFGGGNFNIVEADWNGDGTAEMQIFVNQTNFMTGTDFVL